MPPPRIPKGLPKPVRRAREGMSESHLAMVRKLPCCACSVSVYKIEAHHLLRTGEHGMGRKSSDRWAIPLCYLCHMMLHDYGNEEKTLQEWGIDGRALASALWAARGDIEGMERVAFRFRQAAQQKRGQ